jgi:hypothetical protein
MKENFESIEGKCEKVFKRTIRDLRNVVRNRFPFKVLKAAPAVTPGRYTHMMYEPVMNTGNTKVNYLKPTELSLYVGSILKMYEGLGTKAVSEDLLLKTVEVICAQQIYHANLHNRNNFSKNARFLGDNLVIGDYETEMYCFGLAIRHFDDKEDKVAVNICKLIINVLNAEVGVPLNEKESNAILLDLIRNTTQAVTLV